jgi:hypothetical protein
MFFYKLKKLFKLKKWELIFGSIQMSLIVSFVSSFFILFLWDVNFSKGDKIQMFFVSLFFTISNLFTIYLVSNCTDWNAIFCISIGIFINFLIYIFPALIFLIFSEWSDVNLTKDEIRDAKLDSLFRKLF